ncbi:uncharacterized protein BDZ99DRAFT_394147 [Mytilinidion resinicola]|uniref:Uncharacterized protein n=1 Tax=Mytilinidion resinicola TaxID=574789 RepID=A0A6A6YCM9_9PEZI|nr:uncharacterized protein BDZ99DRAFT_394147 [Mytilinidion resinicola]KAF2806571.1 hypothetical protein BDZ99DRAFT_394147 [Mytilinidion resinicola]
MAVPELDILKPVDPSISNTDDYELFTLSNAQVYNPKTGKPANLLDAYVDSPVTVEGKLDPPPREQQKYLVRRPYSKGVTIEVKNVTRFAWGQTLKTKEIMIWALGRSGWLEIRPSRVYRDKYQEMVEAIEILYFTADIYSQPRKRGGGPSAELLFQEYAEEPRFQCKSKEEASEIFYSHKSFLMEAMLNRSEGIGWSNTPLYQHLKARFPADFQAVRDKISEKNDAGSQKQSKTKPRAATSRSAQPPKRTASKKEKPPNVPKKDDNWWEATAIWELMQKAFAQGHLKPGEVTVSSIAKEMVKKYSIESEGQANNYLRVHGSNLRFIMQHPKRKTMLHFVHEPIFEELESNTLPAATIRIASQLVLVPRKAPLDQDSSEDEASDQSSSSDDGTRRHRHSHKGKYSGLRPKSSKVAGKGNKGKKGKTTAPVPIVNEPGESDSGDGEPMELELSSHAKRKGSVDESLANPRKRAVSESNDLNSPPSSPSSSASEAVGDPLPLRWRNSNANSVKSTSPAFLPSIISSPLLSFAANGPGDSFICTFDGCAHRVYGASTENGKALIKEHFQEHASRRQEQLEIVISEEQRSRLPVSNLIKRIREMTESQQTTFHLPGMAAASPIPTAIERRY